MSIVLLGNIGLPRGTGVVIKQTLPENWRCRIKNYQLAQVELPQPFIQKLIGSVSEMLGCIVPYRKDECDLMCFRKVAAHTDTWPTLEFELGKRRAASFLHVVLHGSATIKTYKGTLIVDKGDVFVLNPNALHEVTSNTLCMTACITVPRLFYR